MKQFVLKGSICYSTGTAVCRCLENGYVVCENGLCKGAYEQLPEEFSHFPLLDFGNQLIIPGLVDLHLHAPQLPFQGLGMDMELMDWLNAYTFPEESKYEDLAYAEAAYGQFADHLLHSFTTRAAIFATTHTEATWLLMDLMEKTGLYTYVGKVSMDCNAPASLMEPSPESALKEIRRWLYSTQAYHRTKPILTPRFVPTCSCSLLEGLGNLAKEQQLPVQSHLSENLREIQLVHELFPDEPTYAHVYDRFSLMDSPCIMAHCVHSNAEEEALLKAHGVYIAHSPESNMNLSSGAAPIKRYLHHGLHVGLATDVAAGSSLDMMKAMGYAIQVSKLRWQMLDDQWKPLTFHEVFYMATMGGGSFFGKVGSFMDGYEFDALVLDDSSLPSILPLTPAQRAERLSYLSSQCTLTAKFVSGCRVL